MDKPPTTARAGGFLTPRKVAWILTLSGIVWFVHISPKTPVEFFDAGVCDQEAVQRHSIEKYELIDSAGAAVARKVEAMDSTRRRKDRIALLYDLKHDPQRIQKEKISIIMGFYHPDAGTDKKLRADNEDYRALAKDFETKLAEAKDKKFFRVINGLRETARKDRHFLMADFNREMSRYAWRQYQAHLFWWRAP